MSIIVLIPVLKLMLLRAGAVFGSEGLSLMIFSGHLLRANWC